MNPLPYVYLQWSESAEPLDTFLRYHVWRRPVTEPESSWVKIGRLNDRGLTSYQDTGALEGVPYQYDVTIVASDPAGEEIESDHTAGVLATLTFAHVYLHAVGAPESYAEVLAGTIRVEPQQRGVLRQAFSRPAPTLHLGPTDYETARIEWTDAWEGGGEDAWTALEQLYRLQRSAGRTLMLRGPMGVGMFGAIMAVPRQHQTSMVQGSFEFVETDYTEAVD